jgi:hypothetical protein
MNRVFLKTCCCLGMLLLAGCSEATLQNYRTQNAEESQIKDLLARFQDALNTGDPRLAGELVHRNLKAMIGPNRKIVSREEYLESFSARMAGRPLSVFVTPEITLAGQRADVRLTMTTGTGKTPMVFQLVREDGRWLILGWQY